MDRKHTTKKVAKLIEVVRNKIKALKKDLIEQRAAIERQVAPLKEPLRVIASEISPKRRIKVETNDEPLEKKFKHEESENRETQTDMISFQNENEEKTEKEESVEKLKKESETDGESSFSKVTRDIQETLQDRKDSDRIYGIRFDGKKYWIGDSQIRIGKKFFKIGDSKYAITEGLTQLLTKKVPENYDEYDLDKYKIILEQTNAHKKTYSIEKHINANKGRKYTRIIGPLFAKGKGLSYNEQYTSSSNILNMLERLELLWSSEEAGNDHTEEIDCIINRLRYLNVIY